MMFAGSAPNPSSEVERAPTATLEGSTTPSVLRLLLLLSHCSVIDRSADFVQFVPETILVTLLATAAFHGSAVLLGAPLIASVPRSPYISTSKSS